MSLLALQDAVFTHLKNHPELAPYTVLAKQPFNYEYILNTSLQSQLGLSILVSPPMPTAIRLGVAGPVYDAINLHLHLIHNLFSTQMEVSLVHLAQIISQSLHLWVPPLENWKSALQLVPKNPWQLLEPFPKKSYNLLRLEFFTSLKMPLDQA